MESGVDGVDGVDIYVDPAAFCAVAARMLAAGGRDSIPAVLTLLGQALRSDVRLLEAGASPSPIPQPRMRGTGSPPSNLAIVAPIDLPVRARDSVLAVLSIEASPDGLPPVWSAVPGVLGTVADLLALTLSAGTGSDAVSDVTSTAWAWFTLDELDRTDLAGDLHDGLVQSLVAARYLLDLAASALPGGPQPWLEAVRESLQAALVDGRALLTEVQPRTRHGSGLRVALEELCAASHIPVELQAIDAAGSDAAGSDAASNDAAVSTAAPVAPVVAAASYRFVQAAVADLKARGGDAAHIRLSLGAAGLSLDVAAVGDHPAWPDEPGVAMQRWATRIELLGGSVLLQPASAHLQFGPADGNPASLPSDVHAGRTK